MYARTTLLEIDTVRLPMADAVAMFETSVLSSMRSQPGFRGCYALTTPEGRAMLITFWDTAAQADASADGGWYHDALAAHLTLFRSPPGRDRYEVSVACPPAIPTQR